MAEAEKKPNRIVKFFKDLKSERKKVTWPSVKDTNKSLLVVIVEVLAVAVAVGLLDFGFSKLFQWLASIL